MTTQKHPLTEKTGQDWLKSVLKSETALTIEFIKKDGSHRSMLCTLKEDVLNEEDAMPHTGGRSINPDLCPVYDLEDHAWKSFRWDSVQSIHFTMV